MAYQVTDHNGSDVQPFDEIEDFRGDYWTFIQVTRGTEYNGTAKVLVRGGDSTDSDREFYATVFDLDVVTL